MPTAVPDPSSCEFLEHVQEQTLVAAVIDPSINHNIHSETTIEDQVRLVSRHNTSVEIVATLLHRFLGVALATLERDIIWAIHESNIMIVPVHYNPELELKQGGIEPRMNKFNREQVFLTPRGVSIVTGRIANKYNALEGYLDVVGRVVEIHSEVVDRLKAQFQQLKQEADKRAVETRAKNQELSALSGLSVEQVIAATRYTYHQRYAGYHKGMSVEQAARQIGYLGNDEIVKSSVRKHELGSEHFQIVEAAAESYLRQAVRFRRSELEAAGLPNSEARLTAFKKIVLETNRGLIARGDGITPGLSDDQQRMSMFAAPVPATKRRKVQHAIAAH